MGNLVEYWNKLIWILKLKKIKKKKKQKKLKRIKKKKIKKIKKQKKMKMKIKIKIKRMNKRVMKRQNVMKLRCLFLMLLPLLCKFRLIILMLNVHII